VGVVDVEGVVSGPTGQQATVRFLVDSGATSTLLPDRVWRGLGLSPKRRVTFTLADGTTVERAVSECHIALPQGEGHTPVILGEPGDESLLGLVLNPFNRTLRQAQGRLLQPMRMLLA
jgi:predicted aspartyl protease